LPIKVMAVGTLGGAVAGMRMRSGGGGGGGGGEGDDGDGDGGGEGEGGGGEGGLGGDGGGKGCVKVPPRHPQHRLVGRADCHLKRAHGWAPGTKLFASTKD
jgi:hypothetical protein